MTPDRFRIHGWDGRRALTALGVTLLTEKQLPVPVQAELAKMRQIGNADGCMISATQVWVSSDAPCPTRTLMHELSHVVLGHAKFLGQPINRMLYEAHEVEAESSAMRVLDTLGLSTEISKAYIGHQGVLGALTLLLGLPDEIAVKVQRAADHILAAGRIEEARAA